MPGGKKLVVVLSVLATGISAALFFRKDASQVDYRHDANYEDPFRQRIERRLTADAAWTKKLGIRLRAKSEPATRVSPATASIPQGLASDGQPTFQKSFNPVGALLEPPESVPGDDESETSQPTVADPTPLSAGLTHTIVDGDTLSKLAEEYLGRADRYLEIFELNRDLLGNPDLLPIGRVLRIPPRQATSEAPRASGGFAPAAPEESRLHLVPVPAAEPRST